MRALSAAPTTPPSGGGEAARGGANATDASLDLGRLIHEGAQKLHLKFYFDEKEWETAPEPLRLMERLQQSEFQAMIERHDAEKAEMSKRIVFAHHAKEEARSLEKQVAEVGEALKAVSAAGIL